MSERWTIQQLQGVVRQVLAAAEYGGQQSGRVRDVPDLRTIRYYTTLGLLDKPAEMRGRRALYCGRHALQLAAIKRLQARGSSLIELQQAIAGADDKQLRRWVGLPQSVWKQIVQGVAVACEDRSPDALLAQPAQAMPAQAMPAPGGPPASRDRFWTHAPAQPGDAVPGQVALSPTQAMCPVHPAVHISFLPNVTLVIEDVEGRNLDAAQRAELATALQTLADALDRLGFVRPTATTDIAAQEHRRFSTQS
jgi:DNA-binding transcriptional MerR regulator